jgi:hypothetical protein
VILSNGDAWLKINDGLVVGVTMGGDAITVLSV